MIAAATMYEVRTQVMVWIAAERLLCIYGRATLAIVESSACMIVANMIETVMAPRYLTAIAGAAVAGGGIGRKGGLAPAPGVSSPTSARRRGRALISLPAPRPRPNRSSPSLPARAC